MAQRRGNPGGPSRESMSWWRMGSIAMLFVLAIVAARARAANHLPHMAGPPSELVLGVVRAFGIGVLAAGLLLLAWGRRAPLRRIVSGKRRKNKQLAAADKRRLWVAVLFGISVGLIYQIVMGLISPTPQQKAAQSDQAQDAPIPNGPGWMDPHSAQPGHAGTGTYLSAAGALVALTALAAILLSKRETIEVTVAEVEEEETKTVTEAMVAGQAAVRNSSIHDARQAIVACFAAMEEVLTELGGDAAPHAADTPEEVLRRGIQRARLPEAPARTLLNLFREARFSTHPMGQEHREHADRALAEILHSLRANNGPAYRTRAD